MRNGKIAKQPVEVREELHSRMENGEDGGLALEWLAGKKAARKPPGQTQSNPVKPSEGV